MKMKKHIDVHQKLVEQCKSGSERARFEIYRLYYQAMYNASFRILNNTAEAEDVMQESFLSAFQKIDTFKGDVSFGAWLKKIVINRSLDAIKLKKSLISIENVSENLEDSLEEPIYCEGLSPELVKEAIQRLPEGYRVVINLYLVEGYDHDEISEILDISNATSRTQYHRAKKRLAETLNEHKAVS